MRAMDLLGPHLILKPYPDSSKEYSSSRILE